MGHSIGDALIVASLAALFFGYLYLKYRERMKRLEVVHQERLTAMDKDFPLPEIPIDPPKEIRPPNPHLPLLIGIVLAAFGGGSMAAMAFTQEFQSYWIMPLPVAAIGLGLAVSYLLIRPESPLQRKA